jgi:hypothetical protein
MEELSVEERLKKENELQTFCFTDPGWIQFFGGLTRENILEYFYCSPFFDKRSCNQVLQAQRAGLDNLNTMIGIQYLIEPNAHEPQLFIIREVLREKSGRTLLRKIFYCLDGRFLQSPDVFDLVRVRSRKLMMYVKKSFEEVQKSVQFSASGGHQLFLDAESNSTAPKEQYSFTGFPLVTSLVHDIEASAEMWKDRAKEQEQEKEMKIDKE